MESKKPEVKTTLSIHTNYVRTVCFSPDQTKLCSAGYDTKVKMTNLRNNLNFRNNQTEKLMTWYEVGSHEDWVTASDFSSEGKFLVTGSSDQTLRIWNVSGSESALILEGHNSEVSCVRYFRKDPGRVISGSYDKTIKIWNIERKKDILTLKGYGYVFGVDILPDNRTFVSGEYQKVRFWDFRSGKCVQTLENYVNYVRSVQFHANSFSLASGGDDTTVQIVDFRTFKLLQNYQEHSGNVFSVCFHPSGRYLISGSIDRTIKVFDLFEKQLLFTLNDHFDDVLCVRFSPDGKFFASASSHDTKVFLWNFPLGETKIEDIDEDERVKYLIHQDLLLAEGSEKSYYDCCKRNVLKIRIDDFFSLFSYKFLFCSV